MLCYNNDTPLKTYKAYKAEKFEKYMQRQKGLMQGVIESSLKLEDKLKLLDQMNQLLVQKVKENW